MNKEEAKKIVLKIMDANQDKHLDGEIFDYVNFLAENQPYLEENQAGQQYLAIRTYNHLGYGRSRGVGVYLSTYLNLVPQEGQNANWIQILENLSTLNNKLVVLGNHGQTLDIDTTWLIEECVKYHLR